MAKVDFKTAKIHAHLPWWPHIHANLRIRKYLADTTPDGGRGEGEWHAFLVWPNHTPYMRYIHVCMQSIHTGDSAVSNWLIKLTWPNLTVPRTAPQLSLMLLFHVGGSGRWCWTPRHWRISESAATATGALDSRLPTTGIHPSPCLRKTKFCLSLISVYGNTELSAKASCTVCLANELFAGRGEW